jgi:hypothetical protein
MPPFIRYWLMPGFVVLALFLLGCLANRRPAPALSQALPEENILVFKHVGPQTYSVPVLVVLPDTATLQHEIPNAAIQHWPRAAFDSACAYYNTRLPQLLARPVCGGPWDDQFGAYRVTVKRGDVATAHVFPCRDCTRASFATVRDEQHGHTNAAGRIRGLAGTIVTFTSRYPHPRP